MRKIIQIATMSIGYAANKHADGDTQLDLYALCDDGTLWIRSMLRDASEEWAPLAGVPQGDDD
jgi:hypothetical protein